MIEKIQKVAQYIMSFGGVSSIFMLGLYFKVANKIVKLLLKLAIIVLAAGVGIYLLAQSGVLPIK